MFSDLLACLYSGVNACESEYLKLKWNKFGMKYESKKNLNWCKLAEALHRQWRIQGRGLRGQPPFIFRPNRGQEG